MEYENEIEAQDDLNEFNARSAREQDEIEKLNADDEYAEMMAWRVEAQAEFDAMMADNRYQNWLVDNGLTEEEHADECGRHCDTLD